MGVWALLLLVALGVAWADVYMHWPRGSNNRLNGNGQDRQTNNRLFDSQNNARGGYCWGPPMYFYVGSLLTVEWTNQHECGINGAEKSNCQIILQYMCAPKGSDESVGVRDGTSEQQIRDDVNKFNLQDAAGGYIYGMHEDFWYYQNCKARERNKGLFTADRPVSNNAGARATRQNNNGGASGFECPEERDYYPYWHPSPWKDIAILTSETERCSYYQAESQNVKAKGNCSNPAFGTRESCESNGGTYNMVAPWGIAAPQCLPAPFSRDNHLGNGLNGHANTYNWTIPNDPAERCVLRLRYNISTYDKPPRSFWDLTAANNGAASPVKGDPWLPFVDKPLKLAIDTSQFGRTFQDRSHVFEIRSRPGGIDGSKRIYNLGVRGKRGNIVQVYPSVEYDFVPNILNVKVGDYVHVQWTGCDNNPANNDGEGKRKTDRSNMVPMNMLKTNHFLDYLNNSSPDQAISAVPGFFSSQQAMLLAHVGQTGCLKKSDLLGRNNQNADQADQDIQNCAKLNLGPRYFDAGAVAVSSTGSYKYISSRNNNFSNRSQKATINSSMVVQTFGIVLLSLSGAAFVFAIIVAVVVKAAPASSLAVSATG